MNEALTVFLHLDMEKEDENEALIRRIDRLLLTVGLKYSGFRNIYIPVNRRERDSAVFHACRLLEETDWLKGIFAYTGIMTWTNACPVEKILTDNMTEPMQDKFTYYEQYYLEKKELPHAIVVDENRQLRDGYISYLLAKKYDITSNVCEALQEQPLRKSVLGRHVRLDNGEWKIKSDKLYCWIYTLNDPVVPGDILRVKTKRGQDFICVDRVDYVAGREYCAKYKRVKLHTGMRMKAKD